MEFTVKNKLHPPNKAMIAVIIGSAIALAASFFVWKNFFEQKTVDEIASPPISVPVVPVTSKTLFREDQLPGEIEAYQDVLIYPKIPGFIKWIGVDRGSVVKEGQLIARMYAPEYLARRNEALAGLSAARAAVAAEESKLQDVKADLKDAKLIY